MADLAFHCAVLLTGTARNSEGMYLRLIAKLIGDRFVSSVALQSLGEARFAGLVAP